MEAPSSPPFEYDSPEQKPKKQLDADPFQPARSAAIQIGNLPGARTVSAKAQLDATAARLRAADASGDPNEMLAALQASTSLDLPDGVAMTPELQKLTATMRQRIGAEPDLRRLDALRVEHR